MQRWRRLKKELSGAGSGSTKNLPLPSEGRVRFTQELWKPSPGFSGNLLVRAQSEQTIQVPLALPPEEHSKQIPWSSPMAPSRAG